jgi:hypothetical protein
MGGDLERMTVQVREIPYEDNPSYKASLRRMFSLCRGNDERYLYQDDLGKFRKWEEPLKPIDITLHVEGKKPLTIYTLLPDKKSVYFACLDIDDPRHKEIKDRYIPEKVIPQQIVKKFMTYLLAVKITHYNYIIADSGGGFHLWLPFKEKVLAQDVRLFLYHYILRHFSSEEKKLIEIFPKHNMLTEARPVSYGVRMEGYSIKRKWWSQFLNANFEEIDDISYIIPLDFNSLFPPELVGVKSLFYVFDVFLFLLRPYFQRKLEAKRAKYKGSKYDRIRSCIPWIQKKRIPLVGEHGHKMRFSVCKELYLHYEKQALTTEEIVKEIVDWFQCQDDYEEGNHGKTFYQVNYLIRRELRENGKVSAPYRCETIQKLGFCLGIDCPLYRIRINKRKLLEKEKK